MKSYDLHPASHDQVQTQENDDANEMHKENNQADQRKSRNIKVTKTVALALGMVVLGVFLELAGPTLPYLKLRIGTESDEEIAEVLLARSVGYLIGSLLGGYLCNSYVNFVDFLFSVSYFLAAIGTGAAPWCKDKISMGSMFFLQGIAQGCSCTGGNAVALSMWGDESGAPLVAQHFGFGIGALIAPQLANAFIYENIEITTVTHPGNLTSLEQDYPLMKSSEPVYHAIETTAFLNTITDEIEIAYLISSLISLTFSIVFIAFFILETKVKKQSSYSLPETSERTHYIVSPGYCTDGHTQFGTMFFALFFILFIHIVGGERAYTKYLYTFAVGGIFNFDSSKASNLNSIFWLFFTLGQGMNLITAHFLNPVLIMIIIVVMNVINGSVLAAFGRTDERVLWIFSCSYGMFLSPLFPTALVWANRYVQMTAVAVSVAYIGSAVGGMIYQYLVGALFDQHGEGTLMFVILGFSINLAFVFTIMQVLVSFHRRRGRDRSSSKNKLRRDTHIIAPMLNILKETEDDVNT